MMRDDEPSETPAALQMTREEARATLEQQLATLDDIDTKAAKILRLNVVVAGALLTVVSITVDAEVGLSPLYNRYTLAGAASLLGSTVFAALTYTVSDTSIGLSDSDVRAVVAAGPDKRAFTESLLDGYADWIAFNYRANVANTPLITLTLLLLIYAVTGFGLGVLSVVLGAVHPVLDLAVVAMLVTVTYATKIHEQIRRWWRVR